MEGKLRYAMVGGGPGSFIGPVHRAALAIDSLAECVDGCYSHRDDFRAMLDRVRGRADFIVVCTPNDSHAAIAREAIARGFDVMCEKPLACTAEEAAAVCADASAAGRILGVPFTYAGYPMVKLARDLIAAGELGKVCKVVVEYAQGSFRKIDWTKPLDARNAWKLDPQRSGPSCAVADIGVHAFHLVATMTGLEPRALLADLSTFVPGGVLDDDASVLLRLEGGAKATLAVSKIATGEENGLRLKIYGERASLVWSQEDPDRLTVREPFAPMRVYSRRMPCVRELSPAAWRAARLPAGHPEGFLEALANIYGEFCAAVRDRGRHDYPTGEDGLRTVRLVDAALASAACGSAWVDLS